MKYIRTKAGHIFEVVDYEQLDKSIQKKLSYHRYLGLDDYIEEEVFVKINKQMPNPIFQYQPIKMFEILRTADTIEELCDGIIVLSPGHISPFSIYFVGDKRVERLAKNGFKAFGFILTDKGLIYVAKMNEKGELELL